MPKNTSKKYSGKSIEYPEPKDKFRPIGAMPTRMIEIIIPNKIPTVNHLYWHRGNIKIIKKEARELRDEIALIINGYNFNLEKFNLKKLKVDVEIHEDWLTKKGTIKKKDIMNREKFLTDSVFKTLKLDDMFIYDYNIKKVQSTEEKAVVRIGVIDDGEN